MQQHCNACLYQTAGACPASDSDKTVSPCFSLKSGYFKEGKHYTHNMHNYNYMPPSLHTGLHMMGSSYNAAYSVH